MSTFISHLSTMIIFSYEQMSEALKNSFQNKCDIIISTGCVSMGDRDILKEILQKELSAVIHFGRVNMKPGY